MKKSEVGIQESDAAVLRSRNGLLTRSKSRFKSSAPVIRRGQETLRSVYTIGKELGSGSFGVTYKCKEKATGEKFACKSIYKNGMMTREKCEDLKREVEIMQRLAGREKIVQLRAVYEDEDCIHLVMERCFGGQLFYRFPIRGYYGEREAARIFKQIVEGVQACHSAGVMHRDLKLDNILFSTQEEDSPIKLIDFGLSELLKNGEGFQDIVGAPLYTAPEMYTGKYSKEADIWSLGIILYLLMSGVFPFREFQVMTTDCNATGVQVPFHLSPWENISGAAKDLLKKMLQQDPRQRLTADEVLRHPWILVKSKQLQQSK